MAASGGAEGGSGGDPDGGAETGKKKSNVRKYINALPAGAASEPPKRYI